MANLRGSSFCVANLQLVRVHAHNARLNQVVVRRRSARVHLAVAAPKEASPHVARDGKQHREADKGKG